MFNAEKKL